MVWTSVAGELLLVVACAVGVVSLLRMSFWPGSRVAAVGLVAVGIAAALGALKYGGVDDIESYHRLASKVAFGGLATLGFAWCGVAFRGGRVWTLVPMGVLLVSVQLAVFWNEGPWAIVVGLVGVGAAIVGALAIVRRDPVATGLGVLAALGLVLNGLVVAGDGAWLGVPRMDYFHVGLVSVIAAHLLGLRRVQPVD